MNPRTRTRGPQIASARHGVLGRLNLPLSPPESRVTLINRAPSLPFYLTEAESRSSGADRRSIPNIADLAEALGGMVNLQLFEGEHLQAAEQVRAMSETTVLIGQHGAGLANMVWMAPGGVVVEILPKILGRNVRTLFRGLARSCGHTYVAVAQENGHAPVDIARVVRAVMRTKAAKR
jgi:capsular polysaccharide biosynthesis protein